MWKRPTCRLITMCVKPTRCLYYCFSRQHYLLHHYRGRGPSLLALSIFLSAKATWGARYYPSASFDTVQLAFYPSEKMSPIILNNIPAYYPGLRFSEHRQCFGAWRLKISIVSCWETRPYQQSPTYLLSGQGLSLSLEEVLLLDPSKERPDTDFYLLVD